MKSSTPPKSLTALALTQLRLDVEVAMQKAGRGSLGPVDYQFFDPLYHEEETLREYMVRLGLAHEFDAMRSRAEAKFPLSDPKEEVPAEDRYKAMDSLGMKGVIGRSALWAEAADVSRARVDQFAAAIGISNDFPAQEMNAKIALRYVQARAMGLSEFSYWAMFAVFTLLDDEQYEQLVGVARDMGLMLAGELVTALHAEPLGARMKRRAETGGAPSVIYEFKAPSGMQG